MASFKKPIENISSQEELFDVLQKALKLQIPVIFEMPFMTKDELAKLSVNPSFRFSPNFVYSNYYQHTSKGILSRIDRKQYVIINPEDPNLVTDSRLTISELYDELVNSEDFEMFIDGRKITFNTNSGESESLKKNISEINSLEEFVNVIKKLAKVKSNRVDFEMPFLKKEYAEDLKQMDSYNRIRNQMDPSFKQKYEEISDGKLSGITLNKYVFITPVDNDLLPDSRLTFNELYNSLKNDGEDYRMRIDGNDVKFTTNESLNHKGTEMIRFKSKINEDEIGDNQSPIDIARRMGYDAAKSGDKNKFDANLRSLMNNHPGDKQREDIHKAFISGMDDFKEEGKLEEKDLGKPGKNFDKIADKAAKEYGSKEAGEKVAGAVLAKLRKEHPRKYAESVNEDEIGDNQSPKEVPSKIKPKEDKESVKKKFVIELSFPYDGDSTLADKIQDQIGKKAEVNEVLRTRRIMEFDYKNESMFNAAMEAIRATLKDCGKENYKLDSRIDDDVTPKEDPEVESLKEDIKNIIEANRYPITVTLPLIIESLTWASKIRANEAEILRFANSLIESNTGNILDV